MSVNKNERVLIVISSLVTGGDWDKLYEYADKFGVKVAQDVLGSEYAAIEVLKGNPATKANFVAKLRDFGADATIKAVDVIFIVHGAESSVRFAEGTCAIADLGRDIAALGLRKLRLLYSLACYGAHHAPIFTGAGFKVAVGARGVNANAADEYPDVLLAWRAGFSIGFAIDSQSKPWDLAIADGIAKFAGFDDADSKKEIFGDRKITISSGIDTPYDVEKQQAVEVMLGLLLEDEPVVPVP